MKPEHIAQAINRMREDGFEVAVDALPFSTPIYMARLFKTGETGRVEIARICNVDAWEAVIKCVEARMYERMSEADRVFSSKDRTAAKMQLGAAATPALKKELYELEERFAEAKGEGDRLRAIYDWIRWELDEQEEKEARQAKEAADAAAAEKGSTPEVMP